MQLFKRENKPYCQLPNCSNELPVDPAKVVFDEESPTLICDECAQLLDVIQEKMEGMLDDKSL